MNRRVFHDNNARIICDLVNRIMCSMELDLLFVYGNPPEQLSGLYSAITVEFIDNIEMVNDNNSMLLMYINEDADYSFEREWLRNRYMNITAIIWGNGGIVDAYFNSFGTLHNLEMLSGNEAKMVLVGGVFNMPFLVFAPEDFRVLAIIHIYNEEDVIENTIRHLREHDVDVYCIDNWSTDKSYEKVLKLAENEADHVFVERFPKEGGTEYYDWYHQLERTEEISKELNYQWYIHYDADEIRIPPWKQVKLRDAIYYIDSLGYNIIENSVIDFKLTTESDDSIFMRDNTFFVFRNMGRRSRQLKTWKNVGEIDLKSSGGHVARIPYPRVFPLKILNRHYPFRFLNQAMDKVFKYRNPRYEKEHRERGWHGHYNCYEEKHNFIYDADECFLWDKSTFTAYYIPLFFECGFKTDIDQEELAPIAECEIYEGETVAIYGAGKYGMNVYRKLSFSHKVIAWVDQDFRYFQTMYCKRIESPEILSKTDSDKVVIAIKDSNTAKNVMAELVSNGIDKNKLLGITSARDEIIVGRISQ
ncbi:MAG: glycosyltransferase family 2 protein [Lachnospiraceae bacterium]|nr:glycosyltransferase family 2 protein [Lachnospiraceae bacterium]